MQLVVGRIGRAHGVRGEVSVDVRTDAPDRRFAAGSVLDTDPAAAGPLRVTAARPHAGRLLVAFEGVSDRSGAEALRGTLLVVDAASVPELPDPEEFWDHQLVGLAAVDPAGAALGVVEDVLHPPGTALLAIRRPDGSELLVPFVTAIVPEVDLAAGRLVVDPPVGLLELTEG
ncbi:MAG: ribosome maturation factor RimM [Actinomycetota bacterium]|nr:ribosome maturation factor RimM [Actinomycetota bacterium]